jgi:hypothetical protein
MTVNVHFLDYVVVTETHAERESFRKGRYKRIRIIRSQSSKYIAKQKGGLK